ncbi:unnamed protein product [Linum trigynum]|uniref:Reverse transcriptase domain-containing protein n=1 Tax=Linum trigynum TaxID=586398 RepID=A0AAV2FR71_9ROSI
MIRKIKNEAGRWFVGQNEVSSCMVDYYQTLFTAGPAPDRWPVLDSIPCKLQEEDNEELMRPFTKEEVWPALKQMGCRKAPGSDGLSAFFFRKYRSIAGDEVTRAVLQILDTCAMPEGLNHTLITLIPKTKQLVSPKDFRPISLCNVLYKIVSKVLANRLKPLLDKIISLAQSAFIPGRFITDNIMATSSVSTL